MAKVIGKDEKLIKRTSCRKCASLIGYTANEAEPHTSYDYGGGSDTYYYLKCPCCGYDINVGSYV